METFLSGESQTQNSGDQSPDAWPRMKKIPQAETDAHGDGWTGKKSEGSPLVGAIWKCDPEKAASLGIRHLQRGEKSALKSLFPPRKGRLGKRYHRFSVIGRTTMAEGRKKAAWSRILAADSGREVKVSTLVNDSENQGVNVMSDHEDKKRPDERVDPLSSLNIRNEIRKEIERATEKIEQNMEKSVDRIEKHTEKSVERIGNKVDSVRSELKDDVKRLEDEIDKRLLKVEARTSRTSYILGLLSVIGVMGGILIFILRAGGG